MRKSILVAGILSILIGGAAIYWANFIAIVPNHINSLTTEEFTNKNEIGNLSIESEGAEPIIEVLPPIQISKEYKGQALEFLGDPEIIAKYPTEFVDFQNERLQKAIGIVKESPGNVDDWIAIGFAKKQFDNFAGTRDVWEHARLLNPENPLNHYNLANLYSAYFSDFNMAERYYLEAIRLDPNSSYTHLGLAEFYRDFYTEKFNQIEEVLLNGLKYLPSDASLTLNLGFYYKEIGSNSNAIRYFEQLLNSADISGNQVVALQEEIDKLR